MLSSNSHFGRVFGSFWAVHIPIWFVFTEKPTLFCCRWQEPEKDLGEKRITAQRKHKNGSAIQLQQNDPQHSRFTARGTLRSENRA